MSASTTPTERMKTYTFALTGISPAGVEWSQRVILHARGIDHAHARLSRTEPIGTTRRFLVDVRPCCVCFRDGSYVCQECRTFGSVEVNA